MFVREFDPDVSSETYPRSLPALLLHADAHTIDSLGGGPELIPAGTGGLGR